jgi:mRNA interferase MazF
LKRGEVWTLAGGPDYAGKPRPVVIVQDDRFSDIASITVCLFTTNPMPTPVRVAVEPTHANGLAQPSWLMADKITTVPKGRLGRCVGRLDDETKQRLNRAILVFLGMAGEAD